MAEQNSIKGPEMGTDHTMDGATIQTLLVRERKFATYWWTIKGIGPVRLKALRERCACITENRDADRLDSVHR